jgi:hypothetical protein
MPKDLNINDFNTMQNLFKTGLHFNKVENPPIVSIIMEDRK